MSDPSSDTPPVLLIVEDDEGLCSQYRWAFPGYSVVTAGNRVAAMALLQKHRPSVVITDLGLPPDPDGVTEGFALFEQMLRSAGELKIPELKVIIATGNSDRAHALRAVAAGAYDFYEKPIDIEVLRSIVDRARHIHALEQENRRLAEAPGRSPIARILTADEAMLKVCRSVERLAATNVPVMLLGESGTGKEALARALHDLGPRARHPFVAINCGAIPENLLESELFGHERGAFTGAVKQTIGKIESADRGTLFLDEIGDLSYPLQVKLLRFLQDQVVERIGGRKPIQVNVRIVSATHQPMEARIAEGQFREDLYYRLNSISVRIPPLRERSGDKLLLARYFLNRFNQEYGRNLRGFTDAAMIAISQHSWPGNVRELENRLKRAVVMTDGRMIDAADLELAPASADFVPNLDLRAARLRAEREVIQAALAMTNFSLSPAAKLLGISRPTLYGLLQTHGLTQDMATDMPAAESGSDAGPFDTSTLATNDLVTGGDLLAAPVATHRRPQP
jgi:two-component system NtrC family response regulator